MFVERYTVVPAVDVEALRSALRAVAAGAGVTVALGPSLLGTLDMDALPPGMHPFVDPDRRIRPLRDDVVLLSADEDLGRARALAEVADLVERGTAGLGTWLAAPAGVLLLGRAEDLGGVRLSGSLMKDPEHADLVLTASLAEWFGSEGESGPTCGADLYVVPDRDQLERVLALRDG
jgi:hypothetical protein